MIVVNPAGKMIGHIRLPERCASLCFGSINRNRSLTASTKSTCSLYANTRGADGI